GEANDHAVECGVELAVPFHPVGGTAVNLFDALESAVRDDLDGRIEMVVEQLARPAKLQAAVMRAFQAAARTGVAEGKRATADVGEFTAPVHGPGFLGFIHDNPDGPL